MPQEHHPTAAEPLCTAIEPLQKVAMCERPVNHPGLHRATVIDDDGRTVIEWASHSKLFREQMEDAQ